MSTGTGQGGSSRRGFLKGVGAAGAGLMAGSIGAGAGGRRSGPRGACTSTLRTDPWRGSGQQRRLRAHLSVVAAVCRGERQGPSRADRGRQAGRDHGCRRSAERRAEGADRRPDGQRQPDGDQPIRHQPRQPDDDRRLDVRGAVHRSRHHVRSDLQARRAAEPAGLAEHPDAGARPGLGVRRRSRAAARPVRREPRRVGWAQAEDRYRRCARGRSPDREWRRQLQRAAGRSPQRREPDHRGPPLRPHPVLQPGTGRARAASTCSASRPTGRTPPTAATGISRFSSRAR